MDKGSNPATTQNTESPENPAKQGVLERQPGVSPEHPNTDLTQSRHRRKAPKEGLCKRRGCKEPIANAEKRLCAEHEAGTRPCLGSGGPGPVDVAGLEARVPQGPIPQAEEAATHAREVAELVSEAEQVIRERQEGTIPQAEAGGADTEPHVARDVELYCGREAIPQWRRVKVEKVSARGFSVVGGAEYTWVSEGMAWRWADACVTQDCGGFRVEGDVFCQDCRRILGRDPTVTAGKNGAPEIEAIPEEAEQPNDHTPPRVCVGVPGAVGEEICHTVLGEGAGERCARCARLARARGYLRAAFGTCLRAGCLSPAAQGSRYCESHKRIAETVGAVVLAGAFEAAWEALAESAELDPITVAACKRLRDKEVRS